MAPKQMKMKERMMRRPKVFSRGMMSTRQNLIRFMLELRLDWTPPTAPLLLSSTFSCRI